MLQNYLMDDFHSLDNGVGYLCRVMICGFAQVIKGVF